MWVIPCPLHPLKSHTSHGVAQPWSQRVATLQLSHEQGTEKQAVFPKKPAVKSPQRCKACSQACAVHREPRTQLLDQGGLGARGGKQKG